MKTMKTRKPMRSIILFGMLLIATNSFAQITGVAQVDQDSIEERKGNLSEYTIPGPASDEYTWEVIGGTIVSPAGATGAGTAASPYVLPFAVGQQSIRVQWPADDDTTISMTGNVSAQRKVLHPSVSCLSAIQSVDIYLWSMPTIAIQDANYEICSGDNTSGDITVIFTGAPAFDFSYTITDMDGNTGAAIPVTGITDATTTIPIPANLVNTSSTVDQTYVVTLTEMNDAFTGLGTLGNNTFTITVHPTIETGDITSDNPLLRR